MRITVHDHERSTLMALNPSLPRATLNILAVEDDPSVAQAVSLVLSGPTCTITTASSAEEAFAAIGRHSREFDVLITDNSMPEVSGGELVRRLRENNFTGKIVVLSAYISPEEAEEYRELGVDLMLPKPFGVSDLRRAVGL